MKNITTPHPIVRRTPKEQCYIDSVTGERIAFPGISEEPTLTLSVIVPAYEEEERRALNMFI